jgi:hypothetical protein
VVEERLKAQEGGLEDVDESETKTVAWNGQNAVDSSPKRQTTLIVRQKSTSFS